MAKKLQGYNFTNVLVIKNIIQTGNTKANKNKYENIENTNNILKNITLHKKKKNNPRFSKKETELDNSCAVESKQIWSLTGMIITNLHIRTHCIQ